MNQKILVTGAGGLVGAEVIGRLCAKGYSVVGLLRSTATIVRNDGTRMDAAACDGTYPPPGKLACMHGDVSAPYLGLDAQAYGALRAGTDAVIHCAAITSFGRPAPRYDLVNFRGTCAMLDFAGASGPRPIPMLYVSTAYVCGERPGVFHEHDLELGQRLGNPYESSKYRAEQAVRSAMEAGLPAAILRPAIIVGDSATGMIRKFDTLYTVLRVTTAGYVRTLPGDYGATLDIVPVDWVADSIVAALERFASVSGRTLHLTSGAPVSLRDVNDVCAEFPSFRVPRYVPRHVFDAAQMDRTERRYYEEVVRLYESYLTRRVRFSRDAAKALLHLEPAVSGKALLRRILRYAVASGYLAPRPSDSTP